MKLHDILHRLVDAATLTDEHRGELHNAVDDLAREDETEDEATETGDSASSRETEQSPS